MNTKNFFIVSFVLIFTNFASAQTPDADQRHVGAKHEASHLPDGADKWATDEHTLESVRNMQTAVKKFSPESVLNYQTLGKHLQSRLNELIKGCTMKGGAHDRLHQWITGLAPALRNLTQAETSEAGEESLDHVRYLLSEFDRLFE